jgi:hypothetical protein
VGAGPYRALVAAPGAWGCWWSLGVSAPSSCVGCSPAAFAVGVAASRFQKRGPEPAPNQRGAGVGGWGAGGGGGDALDAAARDLWRAQPATYYYARTTDLSEYEQSKPDY